MPNRGPLISGQSAMLLTIDSISEIGRFASLRHKAPQLSRLALVFARNAYGKSTICAVLRAAATGDAQAISARRRLGASNESKVRTLWERAGTVSFEGGRWHSNPEPVYVFDQDFVVRNVHVAGNVTRDNKRELFSVVIGQRGIDLARELDAADSEIKEPQQANAVPPSGHQASAADRERVDDYCTDGDPHRH